MLRGTKNIRTRSSIVSLEVLDRVPDWDRYLATYDRASRVVPRLRQKVIGPMVATTAPVWVYDADFDLGYHVRRIRLPEPGTRRQLLDQADLIAQTPLDPARPLWVATLVEGLEGGQAASITHMSHAVTDGIGGVALFEQVYDTERDAERALPLMPTPEELSPYELAVRGARELPNRLLTAGVSLVGLAARTVASPGDAIEYTRSLSRMLKAGGQTPPSPLLRRRGLSTRTITADVDLTRLKAAAAAAGCTVNDAYLAGLCGGLARYHQALGVPLTALPMAIPVSMRRPGDSDEGNAFSGLYLAAPLDQDDPIQRAQLIGRQVRAGREEPAVDFLGAVAPMLAMVPETILDNLDGLAGAFPVPDVQASNVPSYPGDTYLAGARVVGQYGLGPLPGIAMMAVLVTRRDWCHLTFRYDVLSFAEAELLEQCLAEGFDEFLDIVPGPLAQPDTTEPAPPRRSRSADSRRLAAPARTARKAATKTASASPAKPAAETPVAEKPSAEKPVPRKKAARKVAKKATAKKTTAKKTTGTKASPEQPGSSKASEG